MNLKKKGMRFFSRKFQFIILLLLTSVPVMSQAVKSTKNEVVTEIIIRSTPREIWNILTDFEKYPQWHPYIKTIEGELKKRRKIKVTYKKNDSAFAKFSAYIIDYKPDSILSWGGSLGFIFRAKHYFIIQPVTGDRVKFIQGEYWKGLFGGMYGKKIYLDVTPKFEAMDRKLKSMLEKKK